MLCNVDLSAILVLQSTCWGKRSWLLYFNCVLAVVWLSMFRVSSSRCPRLVCDMWLWYFLVILKCLSEKGGLVMYFTVKLVLNCHSKRRPKLAFKTDYCLLHVKRIARCSKRAFCSTLTFIKHSFVIKTCVLSIFEWPFWTGCTVYPKF